MSSAPSSSRLLRRNNTQNHVRSLVLDTSNHFDDAAAKSDHHSLPYRKWRFLYVTVALICGYVLFLHSSIEEPERTVRDESMLTNTINNSLRKEKYDDKTVAFVVTITSCGGHKSNTVPFEIVEGASVLRYSIHQNSIHGDRHGRYDYQLYALYHPSASACAATLTELGYIVQAQETPVQVSEIQNELLRERIVKNGCCGEKELIKLAAFTLTQHALVVLLDLDVLVLQPLDRLLDFMRDTTQLPHPDDLLYWPRPALTGRHAAPLVIPARLDLLYTTDYAMVNADRNIKPTQGGFVILRPNRTVYEDFVQIVREGDFRFEGSGDSGWGGRSGRFWGAMTFQGLMPYYFQVLHPGRALELNWCRWNNMCSPNRDHGNKNQDPIGKCLTQQAECEDCRLRPLADIGLIHFTVCQKPWLCYLHEQNDVAHRLCREFHHAWFSVRSAMERSWGRSGNGTSRTYHTDHFYGYCSTYGSRGYERIAKPYGLPLEEATR